MTVPLRALIALSLLAGACASTTSEASFCESLAGDEVEALLGSTTLETFSIERLEECVWTAIETPDEVVTVRIEEVPDGSLFIEHAIESTDTDRVQLLDVGTDSVLFVDEAVLGRSEDRVALITATIDDELLVPLLENTLNALDS